MKRLDRIMELTDVIEERVLAGDWAGATDLDIERRQLLAEVFVRDPDAASSGGHRAVLEQLRARNEITMAAVSSARQLLSIAARQLESAPAVVRAYERNIRQNTDSTAAAGG